MLTVGSLFSGIGGLDLGLERAGMEVRWQVEIDPYCQRVLAKHWPNVTRYSDIKNIDWTEVEPIDLVCGGFPCQPVSLAGKRLAQDDERWLWPEFARCLRVLRPRFALMENVPGLLSAGFGDVLGDLAALGYDAEWQVIPASAFGAHFRGERVYVVAGPAAAGCLRRTGRWTNPVRAWERDEFTRLVDRELRFCVPAGKGKRVSDGVPSRVDRLRGLGNAVVPQVAEWIGRRIMEVAA